MKTTTLVLLLTVSGALALPSHISRRNEREQQIKEAAAAKNNVIELFLLAKLEELRETMLHGSEDVGVLDPLHEEHLMLDLNTLLSEYIDVPLTGTLELRNLIINNIATFEVNDLRFSLLTQVLQFDLGIPLLEVLAENYDLNLNVDGITINGNGGALIHSINGRVTGSARASFSLIGGVSINIRDINIILHIEEFKTNIENLMGTGEESDLVNEVLSEIVPVLVDVYQPEITEVLNAIVLDIINDILN